MKRIDFFVSEREIDRLCKAIRKAGAPGYSVLKHVTGWGLAGEISGPMPTWWCFARSPCSTPFAPM